MSSLKKVLIIEDEAAFSYALQAKLKMEGFEILDAGNGKQALEILEKERPEVIILDLFLPDLDGFTVLQRIKQNPDLKKIPVVLLTNMSEREGKQRGLDMGAKDYLPKTNYSLDEIVEKIKSA